MTRLVSSGLWIKQQIMRKIIPLALILIIIASASGAVVLTRRAFQEQARRQADQAKQIKTLRKQQAFDVRMAESALNREKRERQDAVEEAERKQQNNDDAIERCLNNNLQPVSGVCLY